MVWGSNFNPKDTLSKMQGILPDYWWQYMDDTGVELVWVEIPEKGFLPYRFHFRLEGHVLDGAIYLENFQDKENLEKLLLRAGTVEWV